jgi:hypothetical protein
LRGGRPGVSWPEPGEREKIEFFPCLCPHPATFGRSVASNACLKNNRSF